MSLCSFSVKNVRNLKIYVMFSAATIFFLWSVSKTYRYNSYKLPNSISIRNIPPLKSYISPYLPPKATKTDRWNQTFHDLFDVPGPIASNFSDNVTSPDKYVIYRCDNKTMRYCGGWGDRVKGMLTAYVIAHLAGRRFKAEWLMPDCDVRKFVVPNRLNWSLPRPMHKTVKVDDSVKVLNMLDQTAMYTRFPSINWRDHSGMASDYFYIKSNHDNVDNFKESKVHSKDLPWMEGFNRTQINRFLFTHLLQPSEYMRRKVIEFLSANVRQDQNLICAHLRIGKTPTIPEDPHYLINPGVLHRVWEFLEGVFAEHGKGNVKLFVMSDSETAIINAKRQTFADELFVAPGEINHVELSQGISNEERCEGLEKVIFEQMILLHCDLLVTSNSGLGRMAAYVRGRDEGLYCLTSIYHVVKCSMMDMKILYNTRY